jgi:small GTP-binding protein
MALKFVFVGDSGTGKTSINKKLITGNFFEKENIPTIGAILSCKQYLFEKNQHPIKVEFWDTAGQEKFRSVIPMYYRDASVIFLIFDLTNQLSYQSMTNYWIDLVKNYSSKIYLIGNKSDLINDRIVNKEEIILFANKYNLKYHELSAKTDDLNSFIRDVISLLIKSTDQELSRAKNLSVDLISPKNKDSCCFVN